MSARPFIAPFLAIPAVAGNMATSITSAVSIIQNLSMLSYDISWTAGASPVGAFAVQVSNTYTKDAAGATANTGNWTTIPLSVTNITGNTGNGIIDVPETGSYAVRLIYTPVSGTGTAQATLNAKVA